MTIINRQYGLSLSLFLSFSLSLFFSLFLSLFLTVSFFFSLFLSLSCSLSCTIKEKVEFWTSETFIVIFLFLLIPIYCFIFFPTTIRTWAPFHKTCHQRQMTVVVISYWNLLASDWLSTDLSFIFCHLSLKKGFVKWVPGIKYPLPWTLLPAIQ